MPNVPIIGQPKIIGVAAIIAFHCTCNNAMQVQVGKIKCNACNKVWLVEAGIKLTIKEIIGDSDFNKKSWFHKLEQ